VTSVLVIGGAGRSGSTLLERLLSTARGVTAVGELRWVWKRGFADNHLCSCGTPFLACPYWTSITGRALGGSASVDASAMQAAARSVDRLRYIPYHAWPRLSPPAFRRALREYGDVLGRVFESIAEQSGAQLIVDSSKEPAYAFLLRRVPTLNVFLLHLVRDSRAVAFSWQRIRRRPEITDQAQFMPRYGVAKSSRDWMEKNALFELYGGTGGELARIRYEDMTERPADTLSHVLGRVQSALGVSLGECGDRDVTQHTISGNPVRFSAQVPSVRPDDEWHTAMGARQRIEVSLLTAPMLVRYGYPLIST
jgi:hypothetical protein